MGNMPALPALLVPSQLQQLGDKSSLLPSSVRTQSSSCHLAPCTSIPLPCCNRMLLRPCWIRPFCQCHDSLGPARAAQRCWGITNSNILCPMSCQSPALPHCHSLPLAISLMRLPREHCTIINYIIIIAWGCPQPRCPCCHLLPSTRLPSGSSQSCSQGTHQVQHLTDHQDTQAGAALQPLEVSEKQGGRRDFSPKACPDPAVSLPPYIPLSQILHQSHQAQSQERMKEKHKLVRTGRVRAEGGLQSCLSFLWAPSLISLPVLATCLIKRHCHRHTLMLLIETGCLSGQATPSSWPPPKFPLPSFFPAHNYSHMARSEKWGHWPGDMLHHFSSSGCKHGSQAWSVSPTPAPHPRRLFLLLPRGAQGGLTPLQTDGSCSISASSCFAIL